MLIPFVDLKSQYDNIKNDIDTAISDVIAHTAFIGGRYVKKFESEFSELYGVKNVVSCANGTDSLYIIMKTLGIGLGDEVITVANSWISSSETISQVGAKPVFVDIDPVYYSINERLIENVITSKTKALILVHLHGQMCEISQIKTICDKHSIFLIEDCAQSHFSEYKGIRAGLTGIAGSFSFYPGKNLGAYGDAGCIITNDDAFASKCRMFATHGALKKHEHQIEGINSRLDGIQAAILSAKLPYILDWTSKRQHIAFLYQKHLEGILHLVLPKIRPQTIHTFHLYVVLAERREALMKYLLENGIETAIHYPTPLPFMRAYEYLGYSANDFPVAKRLQTLILSLPIYPEMTEEMVIYIAGKIRFFYSEDYSKSQM